MPGNTNFDSITVVVDAFQAIVPGSTPGVRIFDFFIIHMSKNARVVNVCRKHKYRCVIVFLLKIFLLARHTFTIYILYFLKQLFSDNDFLYIVY